jgi:hypothetical protein
MQSQIESAALAPRAQPRWMSALTSANLLAGALILVIGLLYALTIRQGHEWGDDFSLYIHHAKNIAEGRPYADTGYLYNPYWPGYSPRAYPPVFPLLLAPVYALFGLNLGAMKLLVIAFFVASLVVIALAFRDALSTLALLALLALVGFNPFVWDFKDGVNSEWPFIFFVYLAMLAINRAYRSAEPARIPNGYVLVAGFAISLAYGTRTLGLLLLACLWLFELLRFRRPTWFGAKVTALVFAYVAVQRLFVQGESSYFDQLNGDFSFVVQNIEQYRYAFTMFWYKGLPALLRTPLFVLFALLAAFGYLVRLRRGITIFELFLPAYGAVIMLWPFYQGNRFLLPIVPLFAFYALYGVQSLVLPRLVWLRPVALVGLLAVTLGAYALQAPRLEYPAITHGVGTPEAADLFAYVRSSTQPDDVVIFQKARALSLYTGRPAASYHVTGDDAELWGFIQSVNAAYIVTSREAFFRDREFFNDFVARHGERLEQVYANGEFTVYQIR